MGGAGGSHAPCPSSLADGRARPGRSGVGGPSPAGRAAHGGRGRQSGRGAGASDRFHCARGVRGPARGAATVPARADIEAFSQPSASMGFDRQMDFTLGNAIFSKTWVAAPRLDQGVRRAGAALQRPRLRRLPPQGRARPSAEGPEDSRVSMLLRLSVPGGPTRRGLPNGWRRNRIRFWAGSCKTLPRRGWRPRGGWRSATPTCR